MRETRRCLPVAAMILLLSVTAACSSAGTDPGEAAGSPAGNPGTSRTAPADGDSDTDPSAPSTEAPAASPSAAPSAAPEPEPAPTPAFDRARLSIDDPTSIWVVNDKLRPLNPLGFVPPDLVDAPVPYVSNPQMRAEAAAAIAAMFAAATAEGGGSLVIQNAYRSFELQTTVHDRLVASLGEEKADAQSARPGYSEHQTGLTADIVGASGECAIAACFGQTREGQWIAANAWRFGFIVRYPEGKQEVTGYIYEPWHVRYVGPELAAEMRAQGVVTLEEFFGLPPAPDYAG